MALRGKFHGNLRVPESGALWSALKTCSFTLARRTGKISATFLLQGPAKSDALTEFPWSRPVVKSGGRVGFAQNKQ
jgi:hypothetical protein